MITASKGDGGRGGPLGIPPSNVPAPSPQAILSQKFRFHRERIRRVVVARNGTMRSESPRSRPGAGFSAILYDMAPQRVSARTPERCPRPSTGRWPARSTLRRPSQKDWTLLDDLLETTGGCSSRPPRRTSPKISVEEPSPSTSAETENSSEGVEERLPAHSLPPNCSTSGLIRTRRHLEASWLIRLSASWDPVHRMKLVEGRPSRLRDDDKTNRSRI